MIGVRFKTLDLTTVDSNMLLSHIFGVELNKKIREASYANTGKTSLDLDSTFFENVIFLSNKGLLNSINYWFILFFKNLFLRGNFFFIYRNFYVEIINLFDNFSNLTLLKVFKFFSALTDLLIQVAITSTSLNIFSLIFIRTKNYMKNDFVNSNNFIFLQTS